MKCLRRKKIKYGLMVTAILLVPVSTPYLILVFRPDHGLCMLCIWVLKPFAGSTCGSWPLSMMILVPVACKAINSIEPEADELIDLTTDDPITIWRDIVRTLITMFKARTACGAGGSSSGV